MSWNLKDKKQLVKSRWGWEKGGKYVVKGKEGEFVKVGPSESMSKSKKM